MKSAHAPKPAVAPKGSKKLLRDIEFLPRRIKERTVAAF